mmetsp:Transcript_18371/g.37936  ORF Transcript_18371/g.37936 Transcript_18371/m.37936 type:complete len:81 (-) Transcript_18371:99-341(-)
MLTPDTSWDETADEQQLVRNWINLRQLQIPPTRLPGRSGGDTTQDQHAGYVMSLCANEFGGKPNGTAGLLFVVGVSTEGE